MPLRRKHNTGNLVNSADQQIKNFPTPSNQILTMCMDVEHARQLSPAALGQNGIRFNSSPDLQDRHMSSHMQPHILDSCPAQVQMLSSQRTASASALSESNIVKQLPQDLMLKILDPRPLESCPGYLSSDTTLNTLFTPVVPIAAPILESQAAHALTTLRSRQIQTQSYIDTCTTSLLCQQQACSKRDCPSSSQVICAAEEIEARFCDGNCAGSLCTGVGCPYNVDPYGYHGFDHSDCSDFWSCQWACDLETCDITTSYKDTSLDPVADDRTNNHRSLGRLTEPVDTISQQLSGITPQDYRASNEMHCSIYEITPLVDADAADIDWHFQSCHSQPDIFGCHWKNCQTAGSINNIADQHSLSKDRPYRSHSNSDTRSSPSTDVFTLSSPALIQQLKPNMEAYTCKWITDQGSRMICGFSCGHGNDMQAHIETNHIEPQLSSAELGRKKSLTKFPRSLSCHWQDCKHSLQRKTLRSTQALRQHIFTHSGCL